MNTLQEKLQQIEKRESQLKEQKRKLLKQQSDKERKTRTQRLIAKGAILETAFNIKELTKDETQSLLITIAEISEVKELLLQKRVIENKEEEKE